MNTIISKFVREQKRYSKSNLKDIFNLTSNEVDKFIDKLKSFGILKVVKYTKEQKDLSDLVDVDTEISDTELDDNSYLYVFTYVGIITIGNRIIKCYPKYIFKNNEPLDELKKVLKVLNKYGTNEQIINLYNGDDENKSFNLLPIILYLLNDYYEYSVYTNTEDIVKINGEGEIIWNKTINDSFCLISNNKPYYLELYTKKTIDNEFDYFKRLHECILTECSNYLENAGLLDLFDLDPISLSEESIDDFGDIEYILYKLQTELSLQYNTRKQILLKTLYAYISQKHVHENNDGINLYGTNSFNLIWEKICAQVFDNKLNTPLAQLALPTPLSKKYDPNIMLKDIIEKPTWTSHDVDTNCDFEKKSPYTLVPDIISIFHNETSTSFIIFDAKYYTLQLEKDKALLNAPGIADITKQYLYQLAFKEFIKLHNIKLIRNCFLLPTENNHIINKGTVKMNILNNLKLENIDIRLLPAEIVYDYYLANKSFDINLLNLK